MRALQPLDAPRRIPERASSRTLLARWLTTHSGRAGLASFGVPAPSAHADALLAAMPREASALWDTRDTRFAGLGAASVIAPEREALQAFFADFQSDGVGRPRLFGGRAFARGSANRYPWQAFGDGFFVMPRWTYEAGLEPSLRLSVDTALLDATEIERVLVEFDRIWACLTSDQPALAEAAVVERIEVAEKAEWIQQVEEIRTRIGAGEFRKIVAARHALVELNGDPAPRAILQRLGTRFPGCARFGLWRDGAAFVGATPERLIRRDGLEVKTEALAGSVEIGRGEALLASPKERDEHQLVVDAIVQALQPFCAELEVPAEPQIRELPNLLHMQTPISGRLRRETHVLDLVDALHPTPAVGGVPTKASVNWIIEHERAPRGWYAGPMGWVDADGNGEFVVALRSGLIEGDRAWVFAGAGIMRDSEPEAEYAETELKMQALLGALHGSTG